MRRIYFTILLLLLCISASFAQSTKPNICSPTGVLVNSFTGNMYYFREDLAVPTIGNNKLDFSFYYNSANSDVNYGYGKGWTFTFHMRYFTDSLGIVIENNNGLRDLYTFDGTNYTAPKGNQNKLVETSDGQYQLTLPNGDNFYFEDSNNKRVSRIVDANENEITLAYNDTLITSVSGPAGRTFNLSWSDGLLSGISESFGDKNLNVNYSYDDSLCLVAVTDPIGNQLKYAYDDNNKLTTLTDKKGNATKVIYNSNSAVKRIYNDCCDRTIRYDSIQNITVVVDHVDAGNQFTTYYFDDDDRIIKQEGSCCGNNFSYEYDNDDNIISYTDANGYVSTFTYDDRGNRLTSTNALDKKTTFTYHDDYSKVTSITLPLGNQQTFAYDDAGNLTQITLPDNSTQGMEYNSQGLLTKSTDALGNESSFSYDTYGNLTSVTNALGETTSMEYDDYGNLTKITNAAGGYSTFTYDKLGRVTETENSIGAKESYIYDAEGNLTKHTDALGNVTSFEYDEMNHLVKSTNALNGVATLEYDKKGKVISQTNELGLTTKYEYDTKSRLIASINPLNETTQYFYDSKGNITGVEMPNGNVMSYIFDAADRLTEISDNIGVIATYTYDDNGNRISETDASGNTTTLAYDNRDRLTTITQPLKNTATLTYDANSNIIEQEDGMGAVTSYEYDALNRVLKSINAAKGEIRYTYNPTGNLETLTDPNGNATSYEYDDIGRLLKEIFPDNTSVLYAYDKVNNITSKTKNNGDVISYSYDALSRLTTKTFPDNKTASYSFDAIGRMTQAVNSDATVNFAYDDAGRLLTETLNGKTTSYSYDVKSNKQAVYYPGGRELEQVLNARGRFTQIINNGSELVNFAYTANGQVSQKNYANGLSTDYAYDENNRLTRILSVGIQDLQYAYNQRNHITSRTNAIKSDWSEAYQYDDIGQVTQFQRGEMDDENISNPLSEIAFTYDANGNRTKVDNNGSVDDYTTNNMNAYTSIVNGETITPEYDTNGNMLFDGNHNYAYNYENKIISVDDGETATYAYDALGRRIKKTTDTETVLYYYAGQHVVEERNADDVIQAEYIYGQNIDEVLHMIRDGEGYFYHTDILGSVHALTNSKGKVEETYTYDAFGSPTVYDKNYTQQTESQMNNPYLFTGRRWDKETQLYYYRARYYSASLGRFLQRDPIGYGDGVNLYRYCGNNPINNWDLFGLDSKECNKKLIDYLAADVLSFKTEVCLAVGWGGCVSVGSNFIISGQNASWIPVVELGIEVGAGEYVKFDTSVETTNNPNKDYSRNDLAVNEIYAMGTAGFDAFGQGANISGKWDLGKNPNVSAQLGPGKIATDGTIEGSAGVMSVSQNVKTGETKIKGSLSGSAGWLAGAGAKVRF